MENRLETAEELIKLTLAWAEIEAKGRVYRKFLAGALSKEVVEMRYDYWVQPLKDTV